MVRFLSCVILAMGICVLGAWQMDAFATSKHELIKINTRPASHWSQDETGNPYSAIEVGEGSTASEILPPEPERKSGKIQDVIRIDSVEWTTVGMDETSFFGLE